MDWSINDVNRLLEEKWGEPEFMERRAGDLIDILDLDELTTMEPSDYWGDLR